MAIKVTHTEHGYDFISLYFKDTKDLRSYSEIAFKRLKQLGFKHMELQRKNFRHLPGDVPHFHSDGEAKDLWDTRYHHFHILYPHKPTSEDWEYLYTHLNNEARGMKLDRNLESREVKRVK